MTAKIVLPLTPVNHYSRLPDGKSIQQFLQYLSKQAQKLSPPQKIQSFRTSFLAAKNLNDAYLIACFCFGGLVFLQKLKSKGISQQVLFEMGKKMSQFNWTKDKNGFELFEYNSKKFGSIYPFYYQKIFQVLDKNDKNCKELFEWVKQKTQYLYGLKIRKWINTQSIKQYRQLRKQYQEDQVNRVNGNNYLLFAKTSTEAYNLGVIFEEIEFQSSRNTNLSDYINNIKLNENSVLNTNTNTIPKANSNTNTNTNNNFQPDNIGRKSTSLMEVKLQVNDPQNKKLDQIKSKKNAPQNSINLLRTPSNELSNSKFPTKNNIQSNAHIGNKKINIDTPTESPSLQFQEQKIKQKPCWKRYICCCIK